MEKQAERKRQRVPPSKYFEDFAVGDRYVLPSRTQTGGLFAMFQAASGTTTRSTMT